jgi:hypothetical protein
MEATMIRAFVRSLAETLERETISPKLRNEGELERSFVVPLSRRVQQRFPRVSLFTHPWGSKRQCNPNCQNASNGHRVLGCPRCWLASKQWATVAAFGTKHTFDVVASDRSGTLAVEIKLVDAARSKMPNGDIQRFLGQCALAASKHDLVIGLCGHRGSLNASLQHDDSAVRRMYRTQNVRLIFRQVP